MARIKRKSIEESYAQMRQLGLSNHQSMIDFNSAQLKIQAEGLQESLAQVSPIIFEECYCMNTDAEFVEKVKNTNEISEAKICEQSGEDALAASDHNAVGVHLFVMQ